VSNGFNFALANESNDSRAVPDFGSGRNAAPFLNLAKIPQELDSLKSRFPRH